jgi:delta 1-pyrroline-5-carboxylate dehydrogenase
VLLFGELPVFDIAPEFRESQTQVGFGVANRKLLCPRKLWPQVIQRLGAEQAKMRCWISERVRNCYIALAVLPGALVLSQAANGLGPFSLNFLLEEILPSTNTAAAGGKASLMVID